MAWSCKMGQAAAWKGIWERCELSLAGLPRQERAVEPLGDARCSLLLFSSSFSNEDRDFPHRQLTCRSWRCITARSLYWGLL